MAIADTGGFRCAVNLRHTRQSSLAQRDNRVGITRRRGSDAKDIVRQVMAMAVQLLPQQRKTDDEITGNQVAQDFSRWPVSRNEHR